MTPQQDISQKFKELISQIENKDLSGVAPTITDIMDSSVQGNYDLGGRWDGNTASITPFSSGSQAWQETLKPPKDAGDYTPLSGTGEMRRGDSVEFLGGYSFAFASNKDYGRIHEYGGYINNLGGRPYINIRPTEIAFLSEEGVRNAEARGRTIKYTKPSTTYIPPRPRFVVSEEDGQLILDIIREYYFGNSNQYA